MGCMCACEKSGAKMGAMQVLRNEHRVIEKVLDALERRLHSPIDLDFYRQSLDFLRNFADGCHHAKEERELFPILESAGIPRDGGPIGCMLNEHEEGRALIRAIAGHLDAAVAGDETAAGEVRRATKGYIALLRAHIFKEDNVLFVMAEQALGPQEQELMRDAFLRSDGSNGCSTRHGHFVALADELLNQAGAAA